MDSQLHLIGGKRVFKKRLIFLYGYAVFSFAVFATGTVAWFAANQTVNATDMEVKVGTSGCELNDLHLYKFNYASTPIGDDEIFFDYLRPEDGEVDRYIYNREMNSFGYYENEDFFTVDEMNLYDPLESLITGSDLIDLNTNVIYEIELKFAVQGQYQISVLANKLSISKDNETDILCSSCVDFDVYTQANINDPSLTIDKYLPNYLTRELTEEEELFYKISYLSSEEENHSNFYSNEPIDRVNIYNSTIETDEDGYAIIYLNINYSPETLTSFEDIAGLQIVNAICDYRLIIKNEDANND